MKSLGIAMLVLTVGVSAYGQTHVAWTNDLAVMSFNRAGAVTSLKERSTGRELVKKGVFLFAGAAGRCVYPNRFDALGGGSYRWRFPEDGGSVTLKAESFGPGWSFEVTECSVPGISALYFSWLYPVCTNWNGKVLNMLSDERSGVIVRSPEPETGMFRRAGNQLFLRVLKDEAGGFIGRRGGIVAGPRSQLQEAMRRMTLHFGVYHTDSSGAWSLGNPRVRGSYLFTELSPGSSDDWIDLAERGGFDTIHMHNAGSRGHFTPTSVLYPRGYDDFALCADLVHEAGMHVSMHTLTACINPRDPWITPVCSTDLIDRCTHTLARPLGEDDTEMIVAELPEKHHDIIHSYGSNGNTFRIGTELVQYTGIRREKPYAFTGIRRGAFGTRKGGTYPAGTEVHYLLQRYDAFYPKPHSPLAEAQAEAIATAFRTGRIDQIYFDGSEGLGSRYAIDSVRLGIARRLGPHALIEGSCSNEMNWWYLSRFGAWDHALWGAKLFQDQHSRDVERIRKGDLLEPQMGWWCPRQADGKARGHFLDEMEYFAAKISAADSSMSLQGVDMRRQRITPFSITRQLTVLGWYERLRMAGAFTNGALELFGLKGVDARLRQDADGRWLCRRSDATVHRVTGGDGSGSWTVEAGEKCCAALRVEALYASDAKGVKKTLVSPDDRFRVTGASEPKVVPSLSRADGTHGRTLVLKADNRGGVSRGAWAAYEWSMGRPYRDVGGTGVFGLWIKGDGKGETLCLQIGSGREYSSALSDHYVKIDFTGWRYVELFARERDANRMEEFIWPYSNIHNMRFIAASLNMERVAHVGFYLNEIPPGETVEVEVSAVEAKPVRKNVARAAAVSVNGEEMALPFEMESGEYAELEDGFWVLYSENGEPKRRMPGPRVTLSAGKNVLGYRGAADGVPARAEVSVFALGRPFPATAPLRTLGAKARSRLAYEAVEPVYHAPSRGFDAKVTVPVRAGEKAFLELRIIGPVKKPYIACSGKKWTMDAELGPEDRLFCRDGKKWYVLRRSGLDSSIVTAEGEFDEPLPVLSGTAVFSLGSSDPGSAAAEFDIIKRYGEDVHPGSKRRYTRGLGISGKGDTEGILNSNWKAKEK